MEDKLRLNAKFFGGFDGVITRRDFFLNYFVYFSVLNFISVSPFGIWLNKNATTMDDLANYGKMFLTCPLWCQIFTVVTTILVSVCALSNILRRLNDICGNVSKTRNVIIGFLFFVSMFWFLFSAKYCFLLVLFNLILVMISVFAKGKVTSRYPYEFNWGAFFGTWIWGLFNSSYKTLWQIILFYTPFSFNYALFCGLKGNEWAYKNKNYKSVDEFNKKQQTQTFIFAILAVLSYVLITAFIIVVIFFSLMISSKSSNTQTTPQNGSQVQQSQYKLSNTLEKMTNLYFDSYEITPKENKFYINSSEWKNLEFKNKYDLFRMAVLFSVDKKRTLAKTDTEYAGYYYSKETEVSITKIYSSQDKKLLAEYDKNASIAKAFKFYNP